MLVPGMNKLLDTTVVVENKAGAVAHIGTAQLSAAEERRAASGRWATAPNTGQPQPRPS